MQKRRGRAAPARGRERAGARQRARINRKRYPLEHSLAVVKLTKCWVEEQWEQSIERQVSLDRPVAVKVMAGDLVSQNELFCGSDEKQRLLRLWLIPMLMELLIKATSVRTGFS